MTTSLKADDVESNNFTAELKSTEREDQSNCSSSIPSVNHATKDAPDTSIEISKTEDDTVSLGPQSMDSEVSFNHYKPSDGLHASTRGRRLSRSKSTDSLRVKLQKPKGMYLRPEELQYVISDRPPIYRMLLLGLQVSL